VEKLDGLCVVVLARNEARRLPACLDSSRFAERTLVIDAGSSDDTAAIARAHGAQVQSHPDWRGFGVQRQRALPYCRDARYIFFLDADEIITPALREEIAALVRESRRGAWKVTWEQVAFGRPLTGMTSAPGMPRLFSAECLLGFEGAVHEQALLAPGTPVARLRAPLLHHSYDSVRTSLHKISQYALLGAAKRAAHDQRGGVLRGLASASALFLRLYVLRGGLRHGGAGFLYCYVLAQECFFRYAALKYDRDALTDGVERVS
jgi:glycosyltransferase involved in cell wall biosynthesis